MEPHAQDSFTSVYGAQFFVHKFLSTTTSVDILPTILIHCLRMPAHEWAKILGQLSHVKVNGDQEQFHFVFVDEILNLYFIMCKHKNSPWFSS